MKNYAITQNAFLPFVSSHEILGVNSLPLKLEKELREYKICKDQIAIKQDISELKSHILTLGTIGSTSKK
ncbi:CLUMA_CG021464, isoform A [Clunio marinus]|uniref:CLUMA_CG021464, isoform A n=1 Tax=Clunio marinus TaxID=568069 RepID=A0A1J1J9A9_9DIPT|nr:CLUMA_CG021464, isoform A [Clunio marinus]